MTLSVPIDTREISITPLFRHESVEDIQASERAGHKVAKIMEVVEVRFAGSKNYAPVFPVTAMWKRDGMKVITYAERWAEQYRAFKASGDQRASGTPLELLQPYGITGAQLSLCRTLNIYSIEQVDMLEGQNLKNLGMAANDLKTMASRYLADRAKGADSAGKIAELEAEVQRLRASIPVKEATPGEKAAALEVSDAAYSQMTDDQIKDAIAEKSGSGRPRGNPSRATLVSMLTELNNAA